MKNKKKFINPSLLIIYINIKDIVLLISGYFGSKNLQGYKSVDFEDIWKL